MLAAVIFDFDGVIVNTEPLHYRAMQDVLEPLSLGYTWEDYVALYIGFDDRDALRERFKRDARSLSEADLKDLMRKKADAFERLVCGEGADPYPGVVALIRSLAGTVALGLCSGALRRDVEPILKQLGISRCFNAMVTADDVKVSKPDPACYNLTVQKLAVYAPGRNLKAAHVLAIEDTPAGIRAAKGAGLRVLALPNSHVHAQLPGADFYVNSLKTVNSTSLQRMMI